MKDKTGLIGELHCILHSKVYYAILEERKVYLQEEVIKFVLAQDWFNAYATAKKIGDLFKTHEIMGNKLKELEKK